MIFIAVIVCAMYNNIVDCRSYVYNNFGVSKI